MKGKLLEQIKSLRIDDRPSRTITATFLGDSVTQGRFELYVSNDGILRSVLDSKQAYPSKLGKLLKGLFPDCQFHIINEGVEGNCACNGLNRLDQILSDHQPDLFVVCFGLNDAVGDIRTSGEFGEMLSSIFQKLKPFSAETIFLTPNMMNTEVYEEEIPLSILDFACLTRESQLSGRMDRFMDEARKISFMNGVSVCDCYAKWKLMHEKGFDTDLLLSNRINHPKREMHDLFACSLLETILAG